MIIENLLNLIWLSNQCAKLLYFTKQKFFVPLLSIFTQILLFFQFIICEIIILVFLPLITDFFL